MDKTRIVFVLPSLAPGGAERVMITLMNMLDLQHYEPTLISVRGGGPLRSLISKKASYIPLNHFGPLPLCLPGLALKLRKIKPDIVISTIAPMNFITLLTKPLIGMSKARYIVREATLPSFFVKKYGSVIKFLYHTIYDLADTVICPAKAIKDDFATNLHLLDGRYVWLPNPVNTAMIAESLKHPAPPSPAISFISVGRLVPEKGYDRLIPALKNLDGEWRYTICGDGPDKESLQNLIESCGLQNKVILAGHQEQPWPLMAAADCLVLPSRWEGLPNVVLESLVCGTPVIATAEAGGIHDIAVQAKPDEVQIVKAMKDMVEKMQSVTKKKANTITLPDAYKPESVLENFVKILGR